MFNLTIDNIFFLYAQYIKIKFIFDKGSEIENFKIHLVLKVYKSFVAKD